MTPEMRRTLTHVQDYYAANGVSPTFQELAEMEGLSSKSAIHKRIHALVDSGHLVRTSGHHRAYVPVDTDLSNVPTDRLLRELEKRRSSHG